MDIHESYTFTFQSFQVVGGDEFDSQWSINWAGCLPEGQYLCQPTFTSRSVNFSTDLPMPVIACDAFQADQFTTINPSVHANAANIVAMPTVNVFATANVQFNAHESSAIPLFLQRRPTKNDFTIKFMDSNGNGEFSITAQQWRWVMQLNFRRVTFRPCAGPRVATPFSILLNSVNGTVVDTNSHIDFLYDFGQHLVDYTQEYMISFLFVSMGCNLLNGEPAIITTDMGINRNNYRCVANQVGVQNSNYLGDAYAPAYEALQSLRSIVTMNPGIRCTLPKSNKFNIKLMDFPEATTLWTPASGATPEWILQLQFNPIY